MKTIKAREDEDQPVTQQVLDQAIDQGRKRNATDIQPITLRFLSELNALAIGFSDQTALLLPVANYPELRELSVTELGQIELGFGGKAICLEHRDMHMSISGMISASESLMASSLRETGGVSVRQKPPRRRLTGRRAADRAKKLPKRSPPASVRRHLNVIKIPETGSAPSPLKPTASASEQQSRLPVMGLAV
jgi:hypothetical protein